MEWKRLNLENVEDAALAMQILQSNAPFLALTGDIPSPKILEEMLTSLPPACKMEQKHFFLILDNGYPLALLDYITTYPNAQTCYIGLLLLHADRQEQGYAPQILDQLYQKLSPFYSHIRLSVLENNPSALSFWKREGFVLLHKSTSQSISNSPTIFVLEKSLLG